MKVQKRGKLYAEFSSQTSGGSWGPGSDWKGNQVGLLESCSGSVSWCRRWFNRCVQFVKILHTHVHFSVGLLFNIKYFSQAVSLSIIKKN